MFPSATSGLCLQPASRGSGKDFKRGQQQESSFCFLHTSLTPTHLLLASSFSLPSVTTTHYASAPGVMMGLGGVRGWVTKYSSGTLLITRLQGNPTQSLAVDFIFWGPDLPKPKPGSGPWNPHWRQWARTLENSGPPTTRVQRLSTVLCRCLIGKVNRKHLHSVTDGRQRILSLTQNTENIETSPSDLKPSRSYCLDLSKYIRYIRRFVFTTVKSL